mmetsp:Transcript_12690/g.22712  ORF Transcript_12690/g.22712 Transcript_12690/m.22712 type:complete len:95 (+) Transcript_12690:1477-1761(+)
MSVEPKGRSLRTKEFRLATKPFIHGSSSARFFHRVRRLSILQGEQDAPHVRSGDYMCKSRGKRAPRGMMGSLQVSTTTAILAVSSSSFLFCDDV